VVVEVQLRLDLHNPMQVLPPHMKLLLPCHIIEVKLIVSELWMLLEHLLEFLLEVPERLRVYDLAHLCLVKRALRSLLSEVWVRYLALPAAAQSRCVPLFAALK
jgi:hypothetical protein